MNKQIRVKFSANGIDDPVRSKKLHSGLYREFERLFAEKKLQYFGSGLLDREVIDLDQIHNQLGKAEGFVFMPGGDVGHALKLLSIFVGIQTGDKNTFTTKIDGKERQKALVVVDDGSWSPLLKLIQNTKFIGDKHKQIVIQVAQPDTHSILLALDEAFRKEKPVTKSPFPEGAMQFYDKTKTESKHKICVFCSASYDYLIPKHAGEKGSKTGDEHNLAFQVGAALATRGYGVVSGAGRTHMMGDVVKGAQSKGGWTAGSNTPHIRLREGLPDTIDAYVDMPDIYSRMKVMIEGSDGFVIAPGGAGTIQELLALLHFKHTDHPLMRGKPIVILNPKDAKGKGYWDSLITYLENTPINGQGPAIHSVKVVDNVNDLKHEIDRQMKPVKQKQKPLSRSWKDIVKEADRTTAAILESRKTGTSI
jgi:uncharacterized protein (TIGR00730 family)